jgi:hypothetical protein
MSLPLSDAQLKELAGKLFLLQPLTSMRLTKPVNSTGANDLSARLDVLATDARFSEIGVGVADFTKSVTAPRIWLLNGGDSWRVGSAIAMLPAAPKVDFFGPDADMPDAPGITDHLALVTGSTTAKAHLTFPLATDFDFSERLWLAGARSAEAQPALYAGAVLAIGNDLP